MKNNLIEEDIIRIKKLIKNVLNERFELIKDDNIITEQVYPLLAKYLGKGVASKLETSMGDDVMKNLEKLFAKKDIFTNGTGVNIGKIVIRSASGTEVQMRTISAALDAVAKGKMSVDDVLNFLPPGKLQNGTDFATILGDQLKKPKPKLKPNTNTTTTTTSGSSTTTSNSGNQPFGPRKNNSSLSNPKEILKDPVLIEKNLSDLRKGYPKFNLFESQVDLVPGFSTNARNYVKLNYLESTETVIAQLKDARIELFSAKFGLLASTVGKLLRNPVKTAKWTISALFALFLIKTGYGIYSIVDKKTESGLKYLDKTIPGGETNNSNGESDGAKKGDLD